jgi:cysteine desulfurase/selenocysteine lyase
MSDERLPHQQINTLGQIAPEAAKALFPIFHDNELTLNLSYLDNAATSQKPEAVIKAMEDAMRLFHSPIHRGFYPLAEQASTSYEQARERLRSFIGAQKAASVVFTASATDSINQVAQGFLLPRLKPGQNVWVTRMEHHANYLPWQAVCASSGANLRIIELTKTGELDLKQHPDLFTENTAMIALTYISNVLGTANDVVSISEQAKRNNIPVLIDAAQAVTSNKIDVHTLGCDFLVFSAHKMFGPTGIGLLYIAPDQLNSMAPARLGGGMVDFVADRFCESIWTEAPHCFEAGSPNFVGALGFAAACDFVDSFEQIAIKQHIEQLAITLYKALLHYSDVHIVTPFKHLSSGIVSFYHDKVHAHDLAQIMGDCGIAARAGHHCAQPLLKHLGVSSTLRISISIYNTADDIAAVVDAIAHAEEVFA